MKENREQMFQHSYRYENVHRKTVYTKHMIQKKNILEEGITVYLEISQWQQLYR